MAPRLFHTIDDWQAFRNSAALQNKSWGFVPTMGNLHAGHESLLTRAVAENDCTVLSIFVNPTQFEQSEDLQRYPRTLAKDLQMAAHIGVDSVLIPDYAALYPDNYRYKVSESLFSRELCGKFRSGHFDGVLTVVLKLLLLVKAQRTYFGEKDYQQLQLIQGMVEAFFIDTTIIACPTVRDINGLALSSRNNLLSPEEYQQALHFPKLLHSSLSVAEIITQLSQLGLQVDYIEEHHGRRFGAVRIGTVRLIDNIAIKRS